MAAARQGLPVRLDRAPQRGAAFALTRASRRARTRSIGSRSRTTGSSLIFDHPPPSLRRSRSPGPARYLVARDHRLPALRDVHLLMNVLHRDLLVSARSLALKREQALFDGSAMDKAQHPAIRLRPALRLIKGNAVDGGDVVAVDRAKCRE